MDDTKSDELLARLHAAGERAWWRDPKGLVGSTGPPLVVIGPRADAAPDDLRALGRVLERWQVEFPCGRHIWGLVELLDGRHPRTPPISLSVPFPVDGIEMCCERAALLDGAQGTNLKTAAKGLCERGRGYRTMLAIFEHPDDYSPSQR